MATREESPTLTGRFGSVTIQDIISFLATLRMRGALEVDSAEGELTIHLQEGDVVWGRAARGGVDPGDLLVRNGRLSIDQLNEVRQQGVSDGDLYDVLVAGGHLEDNELAELRGEELCENILRLFSWTPGNFRFFEAEELPTEAQPIRIEVQGLLLEAARRCDEWSRMPPIYNDPQARFEMRAEPKDNKSVSLGIDEWRLLYLVSGDRPLQEIWDESPLGTPLETSRILYGLASARLIQPVGAKDDDIPEGSLAPDGSFNLSYNRHLGLDESGDPSMLPLPEGFSTIRLPGPAGADDTISAVQRVHDTRLTRSQIRVERRGQLVMTAPGENEHVYTIEGPIFSLGRAQDNTLILQDSHVSGRHAAITRDGDHFVIEDCQSSNGIKVGGRKVDRAYLKGGEEVEIFPYRFRFELTFDVNQSGYHSH